MRIEFNGIILSIPGWARLLKLSPSTVRYRIKKYPLKIALTVPKRGMYTDQAQVDKLMGE